MRSVENIYVVVTSVLVERFAFSFVIVQQEEEARPQSTGAEHVNGRVPGGEKGE